MKYLKKAFKKIKASKHYYLVLILAIIGFLITICIFYPGYQTTDTVWQLCQAKGECELNTWHPISMALLWELTIFVTGGKIGGLLILQVAALWSGLTLLSISALKYTKGMTKLPYLYLLIGIAPNLLAITGVIWKDIQMATALLLAVVLITHLRLASSEKISRVLNVILNIIIGGLIFYAVSLRVNAVAAAIPILYFWIRPMLGNLRYPKVVTISLVVASVVLSFGFVGAINKATTAKNSSSSITMYYLDIVNTTSPKTLKKTAPESLKKSLLRMSKCSLYQKKKTNLNLWQCSKSTDLGYIELLDENDNLHKIKSYWLERIKTSPSRYVLQKIETYSQFLMPDDQYIMPNGTKVTEENEKYGHLAAVNGRLSQQALKSVLHTYVINFGYKYFSFLYKAWFWLAASIALLFYSKRLKHYKWIVVALASSALLNILSYAPGSITPDLRFIYWSMLACMVAGVMVLVDKKISRKRFARTK